MNYKRDQSLEMELHFWRTSTEMEVDFILGDMEVAIEVKGSSRVQNNDIKGLGPFL